jgi:hypothetical protein
MFERERHMKLDAPSAANMKYDKQPHFLSCSAPWGNQGQGACLLVAGIIGTR